LISLKNSLDGKMEVDKDVKLKQKMTIHNNKLMHSRSLSKLIAIQLLQNSRIKLTKITLI